MIGRVTYAGGAIVATLNGVDDWSITLGGQDDPGMARVMETYYRNAYGGPSDGYYGQRILVDLADRMGGTIEWGTFPEPEPDAVY